MNSRDSVGASLTEVGGIGERLARKIIDEFGGEDELLRAVKNLEIDRLVAIEGISQRRAIEIANKLLGNPLPSFLKTEKAFHIYHDILELMMSYAHTDYARNRIMLLHPTTDTASMREHIRMVMEAKKMVEELPV